MASDFGLYRIGNLPQPHDWNVSFYGNVPILNIAQEPLEAWHNRFIKRSMDVLISLITLFIIFPVLFPCIAVGIKLGSPGPIFFKQKRTGYKNQTFTLVKFRSMKMHIDADKTQVKFGDTRITKFGKFLRLSHLDELPQFWNVLKGDMSVVGPRPHMLQHTKDYQHLIDRYLVRHLVKPGITGLSQIKGLLGEHNLKEMEERVNMDVHYIENWSWATDLEIIFKTLFQGLRRTTKS